MKIGIVLVLLGLASLNAGAADRPASSPPSLYENNFEKAELDKVPEGMLVLDGAFAVQQEASNKFLELPGSPLETYGMLFGPNEAAGIQVSVRVKSTSKGRRFPTFAVGLNGAGGFRLQVSPAKKMLELFLGDEIKASVPYTWESGSWTVLSLQIRAVKENAWKVEGTVWPPGQGEPKDWMISTEITVLPPAGRPAIWGSPYAGTPIQYDDLVVRPVAK